IGSLTRAAGCMPALVVAAEQHRKVFRIGILSNAPVNTPQGALSGARSSRAQPPPRAQHTVFVRCRQLDREIAEGTSLTRQEPPACLLLREENGSGTAPVGDLAGGQTHLARAADGTSAAQHDARHSSHE